MTGEIIQSRNITLNLTKYEDIDRVLEIENSGDNRDFIFSWTKERHYECIRNKDELHLTIRTNNDNRVIGYILLADIQNENKSINFRRIAISEKGKGYGRESLRLIKKLSFEKYLCHRLWLDVYEDNINAIKLYESEGFLREGLIRECMRFEGRFRSMYIMSMLEEEYKKSQG